MIISGHIWPYLVICDHTWSYVIINFGQQISDFLLDKLTSKALKTRKPGTFCKNTLWINTLWNEHLSLHTHYPAFKHSYTFLRTIFAFIHIIQHLSLHTHFLEAFRPPYTPGSFRLITLIRKCDGHGLSTQMV